MKELVLFLLGLFLGGLLVSEMAWIARFHDEIMC